MQEDKINIETSSNREVSSWWNIRLTKMVEQSQAAPFNILEYSLDNNQITLYGKDGKVWRLSLTQIN